MDVHCSTCTEPWDARALENGFSFFEMRDFQNLEKGHALCRVEKAGNDFNLAVSLLEAVDPEEAQATRQAVVAASRAKYAIPRAEVEAAERAEFNSEDAKPEPAKSKPTPPSEMNHAEPKAAEVRKSTISETEAAAEVASCEEKHVPPILSKAALQSVKEPAIRALHEQAPVRDLGRGGAQHQAIQKRIKQAAEALGFRSTIEKELPESKRSVDLFLERADQIIACEISITTTVDHEVGNVLKCIEAGHLHIAVICINADHLHKIKIAVGGTLGPEAAARVGYMWKDKKLLVNPAEVPVRKLMYEMFLARLSLLGAIFNFF
jgi:hypothetical protein